MSLSTTERRVLSRYLVARHTITEARARGWDKLQNGELLNAAEVAGFDVLLTTDKNMRYQQNFSGRKLAVVVLGQGRWKLVKPHVQGVLDALDAASPGSLTQIEIAVR